MNIKTSDAKTILHEAAKSGKLDLIKKLFEEYRETVNVHAKDLNNETPAFVAVKNGQAEVFEAICRFIPPHSVANFLLQTNSYGQNLLHAAASSNFPQAVKILDKLFNEETPHQELLKKMIEMHDNSKSTSIQIANAKKHASVVEEIEVLLTKLAVGEK